MRYGRLLVSSFALLLSACTQDAAPGSGADHADTQEEADARIAAVKARVRELVVSTAEDRMSLTTDDTDELMKLVVVGCTDLRRMEIANHFALLGFDVFGDDNFEPFGRVGTQLQVFYWGLPRNLFAVDPETGDVIDNTGHEFDEALTTGPDDGDDPSPFTLSVAGTANVAHTLEFNIAESRLSVAVPKGSTAAQTAGLIANTISDSEGMILEELFANFRRSFESHGDFDSVGEISAKATGDKVTITLGIEG